MPDSHSNPEKRSENEGVEDRAATPSCQSGPDGAEGSNTQRKLFDGAITATYPSNFIDSSVVIPIPDHQEVYMEFAGTKGVIVEILERVEEPSDVCSMETHVEDLLDGFKGNKSILPVREDVIELDYYGTVLRFPCLIQPIVLVPNQRFKGKLIEYGQATVMMLALIRLKSHKSDILVTASNSPLYGTFNPKLDIGEEVFADKMEEIKDLLQLILRDFFIHDWNLFNESVGHEEMLRELSEEKQETVRVCTLWV